MQLFRWADLTFCFENWWLAINMISSLFAAYSALMAVTPDGWPTPWPSLYLYLNYLQVTSYLPSSSATGSLASQCAHHPMKINKGVAVSCLGFIVRSTLFHVVIFIGVDIFVAPSGTVCFVCAKHRERNLHVLAKPSILDSLQYFRKGRLTDQLKCVISSANCPRSFVRLLDMGK